MIDTITNLKMTMNTIKGSGEFSNSFWRFIREDIGIHTIYPDPKKRLTFEERQAKINGFLEKVDFEDDKLTANEALLGKWSDEALELHTYVKKLGLMQDYCIEDYLLNFFETLYFQRVGIEKIDSILAKMGNL